MSLVPPRVDLLGVGIHALNMDMTAEILEDAVARDQKGYVCITNVHGIMEAQKDPGFRRVLNESFLTTPDGMPTVWLGRYHGHQEMGRVYGPDLMLEMCERSLTKGYTHYLYGGAPGVAEDLKQVLLRRYPGLKVVGLKTPPYRPLSDDEERELQDEIRSLKPDFFWVGLGCPKQEKFCADFISKLDTKLMLGVGAAFDIHTGRIQDAPGWMKQAGLQWFHRLCQEPRRLSKRYLVYNPLFVCKITLQLLKSRRAG